MNLQVLRGGGAGVAELGGADVDGAGVVAVTSEDKKLLRSVTDEFRQGNENGKKCVARN